MIRWGTGKGEGTRCWACYHEEERWAGVDLDEGSVCAAEVAECAAAHTFRPTHAACMNCAAASCRLCLLIRNACCNLITALRSALAKRMIT
mmetsp:Transcript_20288/g.50074  ORF Transcript_20288/g.50074 Transcript_20288/m.50074 type:complete len:91 (+) Transcript_20288:1120-1392(+)